MASRSGVVPVSIVVLLLLALAVFAPIVAHWQGITWLPNLSASQESPHSMSRRVWVNRRSGFYYCRQSRFYGRIRPGFFMRQGRALGKGYRPAEADICP